MAQQRTVFVTGGAGYIGSHTTKLLLQRGYDVVAYDNLTAGNREFVLTDNFVKADIGDREKLLETFKRYDPHAIMHFAAHCQVEESVNDPRKYYKNNVTKGLTLLDAALDYGVEKFIFSSSAAIYGDPTRVPIEEDDPKDPKNPYGQTKLTYEEILQDYTRSYSLSACSLRYFNAAGSDPDGEIGEVHDPETHLIPLVLEAAQGKRDYIEIFGTDYDTPDGTPIRDFIHVNDLARAHIAALRPLESSEGSYHAYNLGTGRGHSVREVIDVCKRVTSIDITVREGNRRPGDPPELTADPSKAKEELSWCPEFQNLEEIVKTEWNWFQTRGRRRER